MAGGGGGGSAKLIGKKKSAPPSRIRGEKMPPAMTVLENFCPPPTPPHVLKKCLYVAVVLPQQL